MEEWSAEGRKRVRFGGEKDGAGEEKRGIDGSGVGDEGEKGREGRVKEKDGGGSQEGGVVLVCERSLMARV